MYNMGPEAENSHAIVDKGFDTYMTQDKQFKCSVKGTLIQVFYFRISFKAEEVV